MRDGAHTPGIHAVALDATIGGSTADSYLTLTDANTLAANYGLSQWASKSDAEKETALRRATSDIDSHQFSDARKSASQALTFPRGPDLGVIPPPIRLACIYQAEFIAVSGEYDRKQWEGVKGAPLKDAGNGSPLCPRAFAMLARFITRVGEFK